MNIQEGWVFGQVVEWRPDLNRGFARVCPDQGGAYSKEEPYDVLFYPSTLYPWGYCVQIGDMLAMRVRDRGYGPFAVVAMQTGNIGSPCIGRIVRSGKDFGFVSVSPAREVFFDRSAVIVPLQAKHLFPPQPVIFYTVGDEERGERPHGVRVMPITRTVFGQVEAIRMYEERVTFFIVVPNGRAVFTAGAFPPVRPGDMVRLRVVSESVPPTGRHRDSIYKAVTMEKVS